MFYIVKLGTITNAQRCVNILHSYGIKGQITRLKNPKKSEGCGYAVKFKTNEIEAIIKLLNSKGINVLGVEEA